MSIANTVPPRIPTLDQISWETIKVPETATMGVGGPKYETFADTVIAQGPMLVLVPSERYYETTDALTVSSPDGKVTVRHLLNAIYQAYQRPLNKKEWKKHLQEFDRWYAHALYKEGAVRPTTIPTLGESLNSLIYFEGLTPILGGYRLELGS